MKVFMKGKKKGPSLYYLYSYEYYCNNSFFLRGLFVRD